jgi:hypothetical protein
VLVAVPDVASGIYHILNANVNARGWVTLQRHRSQTGLAPLRRHERRTTIRPNAVACVCAHGTTEYSSTHQGKIAAAA